MAKKLSEKADARAKNLRTQAKAAEKQGNAGAAAHYSEAAAHAESDARGLRDAGH